MTAKYSVFKDDDIGRAKKKTIQNYTIQRGDGSRHSLLSTTVERDLGVMLSDDLKVKTQVDSAALTANQVLGRLKKAFRSRGLAVWRTLYVTYIRPHLEFAVQTWSPHLRRDIETLEKIQRRATKTIASIKHLPYSRRLEALGITTLEERRIRGDLIQQYKITHRIDEIDFHRHNPLQSLVTI